MTRVDFETQNAISQLVEKCIRKALREEFMCALRPPCDDGRTDIGFYDLDGCFAEELKQRPWRKWVVPLLSNAVWPLYSMEVKCELYASDNIFLEVGKPSTGEIDLCEPGGLSATHANLYLEYYHGVGHLVPKATLLAYALRYGKYHKHITNGGNGNAHGILIEKDTFERVLTPIFWALPDEVVARVEKLSKARLV